MRIFTNWFFLFRLKLLIWMKALLLKSNTLFMKRIRTVLQNCSELIKIRVVFH